jgi:hypothetical protein
MTLFNSAISSSRYCLDAAGGSMGKFCWWTTSCPRTALFFRLQLRDFLVQAGGEVLPSLFPVDGILPQPGCCPLSAGYCGRGLSKAFSEKKIGFDKVPRGCPQVTHLLFADDTLVFLNGEKRSILNFMDFIKLYERSQLVNASKSCFCITKPHRGSRIFFLL